MQAAGAGRFLGAVVRPLQAARRPVLEKAVAGGRRQGQAGQDEHRRASADRRPARHPVDPGGHRLPARASRSTASWARCPRARSRASSSGSSARLGPSAAEDAARRGRGARRRGRRRRRRRALRRRAGAGPGERRRASPAWPSCIVDVGDLEGAKRFLAMAPSGQGRTIPAIAGARAAIELAEQAGVARRSRPSSSAGVAADPARPSGPLRPRARRSTPAGGARRRSTNCLKSSGATALGTRTARASSSSSSSRPGARRTR